MVDNQQQPIPNQPTPQRVQTVTGITPVQLLVGHSNNPPEASNGFITRDGHPFDVGDDAYPVAVAVARLRVAGLTLAGEVVPGATGYGSDRDGR